jgi:uncharacterized membrane protein HdeD (DUF308 family)
MVGLGISSRYRLSRRRRSGAGGAAADRPCRRRLSRRNASRGALVGGLAHLRRHGAWFAVLLGLLSVIAAVATLYNPVVGAVSLVWVLGAWLVVGGAFELAMSFSLPVGRGWLIFIGLVDLALGTFVVLMNPVEALVFLGYIVGASLVYRGLWSLFFASNAHRLERLAEDIRA